MPTRILVTGSRDWYCPDLAERVLNRLIARYGPDLVIVHGAATGVDDSFQEVCEALGVPDEPHPAEWERLGNIAGPIRNTAMVKAGAAICIAFSREIRKSRGTLDCASKADIAGIPVWLYDSEQADDPVRWRWRAIG